VLKEKIKPPTMNTVSRKNTSETKKLGVDLKISKLWRLRQKDFPDKHKLREFITTRPKGC
jgi:hypothetical protein